MTPDPAFWRGRRVLLTGHTGFKGAWTALWLAELGAEVHGFGGPPPSEPSLFDLADVGGAIASSWIADVRDAPAVSGAVRSADAEVVIHMAAQAIVRRSFANPAETFAVNVVGTANLLDALAEARPAAVVVVTSDKCYRDVEAGRPMREDDPLGGADPYSASKAAQEMVASSYRATVLGEHGVALATARAGNVIGGGDWATDRLVPDLFRAAIAGQPLVVRNPDAIRPWQHVLNPVSGYLALAERLTATGPAGGFDEGWNFGPHADDEQPVGWLVDRLCERWPHEVDVRREKDPSAGKEAAILRLDSEKARRRLWWTPGWDLGEGLDRTAEWFAAHVEGEPARATCVRQLSSYPA
jgi:CDP-glucose 4,6-dehydratase